MTYTLLDDWLPAGGVESKPEDPLAHFARRYLSAYAPATATDFARWSGLSAAQVKAAWAAIAAECVTVAIPGGQAQLLQAQLDQVDATQGERVVRFLPRYDNVLLGYASRAFIVADAHAKQVHPGGGLIRASAVIDGEAKANWKLEKRRAGIRVTLSPFEALDRSALPLLEVEAASLGAFLNSSAELRVAGGGR